MHKIKRRTNKNIYTEIDNFITEKINEVDSDSDEDDCEDEVFLMSLGEITEPDLFKDDDERMCGETYWLRSLTRDKEKAYTVDMYGFTSWKYKSKVCGIRPAMWVDLNEY